MLDVGLVILCIQKQSDRVRIVESGSFMCNTGWQFTYNTGQQFYVIHKMKVLSVIQGGRFTYTTGGGSFTCNTGRPFYV